MHLSPPLAYAALRSKVMVLLLLSHCFVVVPIVCGVSLFCCPSFTIILMGKRKLVALI